VKDIITRIGKPEQLTGEDDEEESERGKRKVERGKRKEERGEWKEVIAMTRSRVLPTDSANR
jgi:hypothetical protein